MIRPSLQSLEPVGGICRDPIDEIRALKQHDVHPQSHFIKFYCVYVCMCQWILGEGQGRERGEREREREEREREREREKKREYERDGLQDGQSNYERGREGR